MLVECKEVIGYNGNDPFAPGIRCGRRGECVSLPCPVGRPNAEGGPYCVAHGGIERARKEAKADWNFLAPESVGDAEAVLNAGSMQLTSRDAYLVLRLERDVWLAFLGIGSLMIGVPNPASKTNWPQGARPPKGTPHRKKGEPSEAWRARCQAVGGYRFNTREEALAEGLRAWRESVAKHVDVIRRARGNTLFWGVPIEPLHEPIVLDATGRNAWDVALETSKMSPAGIAYITGNRPSGEVA